MGGKTYSLDHLVGQNRAARDLRPLVAQPEALLATFDDQFFGQTIPKHLQLSCNQKHSLLDVVAVNAQHIQQQVFVDIGGKVLRHILFHDAQDDNQALLASDRDVFGVEF